MWILFGVLAVLSTLWNLLWTFTGKQTRQVRYAAMAFTALTLCAFYQMDALLVIREDWSALMDITPTVSKLLWYFTLASILLNSISLFKKGTPKV